MSLEEASISMEICELEEPVHEEQIQVEEPVHEEQIQEEQVFEVQEQVHEEPVHEEPVHEEQIEVEEPVHEEQIEVEEPVHEEQIEVEEPVHEESVFEVQEPVHEEQIQMEEPVHEEPVFEVEEPVHEEQVHEEPVFEVQEPIDIIPEPVAEEQQQSTSALNLHIPKHIFITHKSIPYVNSNPIHKKCIQSWTKHKNTHKCFFYDNKMCHDFMKTHFSGDVYQAYRRLPMAVMRADLWRYCVIYKYGGIYADADAMCLVHPNLFTNAKTQLVCGPENSTHLSQWFFASPKNSPILKAVIDLSVKRILEIPEIKGEHIIHYLTGPGCFTDAIEKYLQETNQPTFQDKLNYEKYRNETMCVFNYDNYRKKIIHHFFTGMQPGGWCTERNVKLK